MWASLNGSNSIGGLSAYAEHNVQDKHQTRYLNRCTTTKKRPEANHRHPMVVSCLPLLGRGSLGVCRPAHVASLCRRYWVARGRGLASEGTSAKVDAAAIRQLSKEIAEHVPKPTKVHELGQQVLIVCVWPKSGSRGL